MKKKRQLWADIDAPLITTDMFWDGTFDGEPAGLGTYGYVLTIGNCSWSPTCDDFCELEGEEYQQYGNYTECCGVQGYIQITF